MGTPAMAGGTIRSSGSCHDAGDFTERGRSSTTTPHPGVSRSGEIHLNRRAQPQIAMQPRTKGDRPRRTSRTTRRPPADRPSVASMRTLGRKQALRGPLRKEDA